ncbi:SlyX family protein [Mangrovicella endophytica]|uniref:SlyX family protein n=1 Tax=Mangrovicella endophytica TaxID=2066697 RepID=UPI000C9DE90A|nr:SlyX family protein [Mangrovicella endophytica]
MSDETSRIDDLEIMAAHQAKAIEELSEELQKAYGTIEQLRKAVKGLAERCGALEEAVTPRPEITKPPHY